MLDSSLADREVAEPTAACHLFSAFCLQLADAAVNGQDYQAAWGILRSFFDASAVQLLRHVALPVQALHDGTDVHVLHASTAPGPLRALLPEGEGYGLLAVARLAQRRCDAVLVLRASPFTEAECAWMEMMLAHVRPALELDNQLVSSMPTVASAVHLARLIPTPCALIDEAGRCMQQNAAFGRIVEAIPGVVRDGRLMFGDHYLHKSWQQALLNADRGSRSICGRTRSRPPCWKAPPHQGGTGGAGQPAARPQRQDDRPGARRLGEHRAQPDRHHPVEDGAPLAEGTDRPLQCGLRDSAGWLCSTG